MYHQWWSLLFIFTQSVRGKEWHFLLVLCSGGPLCSQYINFLNHSIFQPQSHPLTLIAESFPPQPVFLFWLSSSWLWIPVLVFSMDCVSPILDVATRLWDCTAKRAVYIRHLPQNLNSLRTAMGELKNLYKDVKERVEREE